MKKLFHIGLMLAMVAAFSACSTGYHYYTAGNDDISLKQYKSFAFAPHLNPRRPDSAMTNKQGLGARLNYINNNKYYNNPVAEQKIKDAAATSLQAKGLTQQSTENADLLVRYGTLVDRGTRNSYYSPYFGGFGYGPGWGWGWGYRYSPFFYGGWGGFGGYGWGGYGGGVQEHFKEGVLAIELIDARTKEPVWIGYGSGELSRDPQKTIAQLPKIVEDIFKQLPVRTM